MNKLFSSIRNNQFIGLLSIAIGLSFLFERYSIIPNGPLDFPIILAHYAFPWFYGLHTWGIAFAVGGLLMMLPLPALFRIICLSLASFSWVIFAASSLAASFGLHDPFGSVLGILFLAGWVRCLLSCATAYQDMQPRKNKLATRRSEVDTHS